MLWLHEFFNLLLPLFYYVTPFISPVFPFSLDGMYDIITCTPLPQITEDKFALYACVKGLKTSQITIVTQSCNELTITVSTEPHILCTAMILGYHAAKDVLYIGFTLENATTFMEYFPLCGFSVKFEVNHSYFDEIHRVLTFITNDAIKKTIPSPEDFEECLSINNGIQEEYSKMSLNEDQTCGLCTILNAKPCVPVLIQGSFGCGKTHLLCLAIKCFVTKSVRNGSIGRILLCCHQQQSADMIMMKYFVDMLSDRKAATIVRLTYHYNQSLIPNDFQVNISDFKKHLFSKEKTVVVVTTYDVLLKTLEVVSQDFFTHILIDDGTQLWETETLGCLLLINEATHVIIAGDTQQVRPMSNVTSSVAA